MLSLINQQDYPGIEPHILDFEETPDGFQIRHAVFKAQTRPHKGTVLLLQGRNEAIEKYLETIGDLVIRGFDVMAFDWRGQAGSTRFYSDKRRGHIDHYDQYVTDLETVFSNVALPECRPPFYIVAHSTGSLIALYAAPWMVNRVRRMMLVSPFLGIGSETLAESQLKSISSVLTFLGLGAVHMGGSRNGIADTLFEKNRVTTDQQRFERNKKLMDPALGLGLGSATIGWLLASTRAMEYVRKEEHMAQIHIPTLMVNAGSDTVVSIAAVEDYAHRIRSGALITIDGAYHEIMQETDRYREQFFAAFDAFIPGTED